MKRIFFIVILFSLILLFLNGCSTLKSVWNYIYPSKSDQICNFTDKEAADFVARLRPVCRGNPESHYLLACYYQDRGRHQEALKEFNKVLSIDPRHVDAYNRIGVSYDKMRDFQNAVKSYKIALNLNPSLHYVYNNLGYSYMLQDNMPDAIRSYEKAIELNGSDKQVHNNLGMAYARNKQFDLAFDQFRLAGGEATANYNLAQLYYRQSMYAKAQDRYQEALALNPKFKPASDGLERCKVIQSTLASTRKQEEEKAQHTHSIVSDEHASSSSISKHAARAESKRGSTSSVKTDTHIVKKNEYVFSIIKKKYNVSGRALYRISRVVKQLNPKVRNLDLIYPGQKLLLPRELEPQMKTALNIWQRIAASYNNLFPSSCS